MCRDLAGKLARPDDRRALELMAAGWAARAAERKRKIDKSKTGKSKIDHGMSFGAASSEHAA